jgi:hypothetical protein
MNMERVVKRIIDMMVAREQENKQFGVIILAEGLAEYLPAEYLRGVKRDEHNHIAISQVEPRPAIRAAGHGSLSGAHGPQAEGYRRAIGL